MPGSSEGKIGSPEGAGRGNGLGKGSESQAGTGSASAGRWAAARRWRDVGAASARKVSVLASGWRGKAKTEGVAVGTGWPARGQGAGAEWAQAAAPMSRSTSPIIRGDRGASATRIRPHSFASARPWTLTPIKEARNGRGQQCGEPEDAPGGGREENTVRHANVSSGYLSQRRIGQ